MQLLEEILIRVAIHTSLAISLTRIGIMEHSSTRIIDSLLKVSFGSLVKVAPIRATTISRTIVFCTNSLECQGVALSIHTLDVVTTSLIATSLKSHTANQTIHVCSRIIVLSTCFVCWAFSQDIHQRLHLLQLVDTNIID